MSVSYCYPYMHTISEEFRINTNYFAAKDLQLFVDSMETIQRIQKERLEKEEKKKSFSSVVTVTFKPDTTLPPTPEEVEEEPLLHLEDKKLSDYPVAYDSDEAYGSNHPSPRNSVAYPLPPKAEGEFCGATLVRCDSEESGVFQIIDQQEQPIYENVVPTIRPRSEVITKPKHRSTRSKIISMILKRNYVEASKPVVNTAECRDRVLDDIIKHQYESMSSLNPKNKKKTRRGFCSKPSGSAEERFLEKALRYLTL